MSHPDRPMSPHLSIYRWPITMTLSILHRMTGIFMSAGLIMLVLWLLNAAAGPEDYQRFIDAMASTPGKILLVLWSFAFFLHFANGIRHLVWDVGYGFEKSQANASAWWALLIAIVLTGLFWVRIT